ncbi:hypothetical protein RhiirA5_477736 [Rhizophagus irregularis]|uniref:Uncharacterized protein n=1 Tax=Rhizophagus irregularis TaxID=588596 RepID=A0A2N0NJJ4_9GLOM|nr:hypothetical protein RhiirA5_477736 [Rhizophagus irregularis]
MIYTNYLEPLINQVNRGPFTDSETNYIYEWVSSRLKDSDMIRWELLQNEIQEEYGKFRLRNDLKYQWNCKRRQISRQCNTEYLSTLHEDDEKTPQSNLAEEKINCMEPLVGKVNHDPFSDSEKSCIYEDCDVFRWDKFRLRNYLKYQWNRMRRQISRLYNTPNTEYLPILNEDDERTPQSNLTEKIDPPESKIQRKYGKLRNALKSKWNRKKRQISRHIFFLIL